MQGPIVQLQAVNIFQKDQRVLSQVNLQVESGEFCYLIGKTGSGKSSLLKTLYGALQLREGLGSVAGHDLTKLDRRSIPKLRRKLGIVFQDFNLLMDRTVVDNLNFVLRATGQKNKQENQHKITEVLNKVGLNQKEGKMPYQLSGGEQQRVAIARALLNDPVLILADEPTGNLDPETSDDILLLLRRITKERGTAVIFATHDYRTLESFPARIIRCHNGKLLDERELEV